MILHLYHDMRFYTCIKIWDFTVGPRREIYVLVPRYEILQSYHEERFIYPYDYMRFYTCTKIWDFTLVPRSEICALAWVHDILHLYQEMNLCTRTKIWDFTLVPRSRFMYSYKIWDFIVISWREICALIWVYDILHL